MMLLLKNYLAIKTDEKIVIVKKVLAEGKDKERIVEITDFALKRL